MTDMIELAERVEAGTGPDRDLDAAIARALSSNSTDHWYENHRGEYCTDDLAPNYTASLDAAMTLVPVSGRWFTYYATENRHSHVWTWKLRGGFGMTVTAFAATPALALTAASLRALANREDSAK